MDSKNLIKVKSSNKATLKIHKAISLSSAAAVYYFVPSFPCKLVNVNLKAPTPGNVTIAITKPTVQNLEHAKDVITSISSGVTAGSSNVIYSQATGSTANVNLNFACGANYSDAMRTIDPESAEAIKIDIPSATMTAIIELEIQPL